MTERFETFTVLMNRISRNIRKIKNQEMEAQKLRSVHSSCLYYLYGTRGLTASDLCERCEEDKATISRALEYLETNGYITCQSRTAKRYKSPLLLTELGERTAAEITQKIDAVLTEIGDSLTEEERISFYRSLSIISDRLEEISRKRDAEEK